MAAILRFKYPSTLASLLSLAATICWPASAGIIFQTGFEAPTYSVGGLTGQDNWTPSTVPAVQTTTVFAGAQAVQYNATGVPGQDRVYHSLTYDSLTDPYKFVVAQIELQTSSTGTTSQWIAMEIRADSGFYLGAIGVDINRRVDMSNQTTTIENPPSVVVPAGGWNLFTLQIDFQAQQFTGFFNSQLIGTLPFSGVYTGLTRVGFGINALPGTDTVFYDNLSIVSAPEPSPVVLLFPMLITLAYVSRKRRA